jgi:hypothetical protein
MQQAHVAPQRWTDTLTREQQSQVHNVWERAFLKDVRLWEMENGRSMTRAERRYARQLSYESFRRYNDAGGPAQCASPQDTGSGFPLAIVAVVVVLMVVIAMLAA